MFVTELSIVHKGCWGSEIHQKFPQYHFSSVDCRWVRGEVVHIVRSKGSMLPKKNIITYLKNRKDVSKVDVLSQDEDELLLRVSTKRLKEIGQFSDIFFQNDCFPIAPTKFIDNTGSIENKELLRLQDYKDADSTIHPQISDIPFIVLRGGSGQISNLRKACIAQGIKFTDFTSTMIGETYIEQHEKTKSTKEEDLEYFGICIFGEKNNLSELTKKFSLWK